MTAIAPATVRAAYQDLCARLDGGVGLILGCCGVIADWAGRTEMFEENQALLQEALEKLGNPTIICACPTCQKTLDGMATTKTVGIWQTLEEIGSRLGVTRERVRQIEARAMEKLRRQVK